MIVVTSHLVALVRRSHLLARCYLCTMCMYMIVVRFDALEVVIVLAPTLWRRICYVEVWRTKRRQVEVA
jgi:hypothetical protein